MDSTQKSAKAANPIDTLEVAARINRALRPLSIENRKSVIDFIKQGVDSQFAAAKVAVTEHAAAPAVQ